MRIETETFVEAPIESVFSHISDIPRWPEFISGITRVDVLTSGPLRQGSRFRETRMMFGREATEKMTVADIEAPRRLVLTSENHGTRYRAEHILSPENGGTRLVLRFEGHPIRLWAKIMAPLGWLMRGSMVKILESDLCDLKGAIESESRTNGYEASD